MLVLLGHFVPSALWLHTEEVLFLVWIWTTYEQSVAQFNEVQLHHPLTPPHHWSFGTSNVKKASKIVYHFIYFQCLSKITNNHVIVGRHDPNLIVSECWSIVELLLVLLGCVFQINIHDDIFVIRNRIEQEKQQQQQAASFCSRLYGRPTC